MAHGLESGASVPHRRCAVRNPVQLMICRSTTSGKHQHRDGRDTRLDGLAVTADHGEIALQGPVVFPIVLTGPEPLQGNAAVIVSELLPTLFLSLQRRPTQGHKFAVARQFRRVFAAVGWQPAVQLAQLDGLKAKPAALSD